MKKIILLAAGVLGLAATQLVAQMLPTIKLQPVFPKLADERPVWMSEAPDGSGRLFVVYQPGKILIVKKGSDGGEAKEFFNIEDRQPNFDNEDGLLSLAFPSRTGPLLWNVPARPLGRPSPSSPLFGQNCLTALIQSMQPSSSRRA